MINALFNLKALAIEVVAATVILLPGVSNATDGTTTNIIGWSTYAPAVLTILAVSSPTNTFTNTVFDHYFPESLNNLIWTNFIAHTNGRDVVIWSVRSHPPDWPANAPTVAWNTNCLMWGMKGLTAISPCWEEEGSSGQIPVTALTRRHGYTRGHGMGTAGFSTNYTGKKVWFVTTNNMVVQATVQRAVVRTLVESPDDYTLLQFSDDLPPSIEPIRVVAATNVVAKYPNRPGCPRPVFKTEQFGNVSADVPEFFFDVYKAGDSGSPDMLPMPGELVFFGGRSTSGPSPEMQADLDALSAMDGLDTNNYQLQWVDLPQPTIAPVRTEIMVFTNATTVTIPDQGAATPYPSVINVSDMSGTISNVTVTLQNLSHTYKADLDILLVSPGGQKVLVMSDAGHIYTASGIITITLSDAATVYLPATTAITNGTYKPTNYTDNSAGGDNFPVPAPAPPYAANLGTFNGQSPNGTWSLYVFDDGAGDKGTISGGWSLNITTSGASPFSVPGFDPPPQITSLAFDAQKVTWLTVSGNKGVSYALEASSDLVNWTQIAVQVNTNGSVVFSESQTTNTLRFYRAVSMPK